jgi:hypothetical protein
MVPSPAPAFSCPFFQKFQYFFKSLIISLNRARVWIRGGVAGVGGVRVRVRVRVGSVGE